MNVQFTYKKWQSILVLLFTMIATSIAAQVTYTQQGTTQLTVSGTSTIHNWKMISENATYNAQFETSESGKPVKLISLDISLPAESLKSGKSAMDKNAYTALKTDQHKTISFKLSNNRMNVLTMKITGKLTIAGSTKEAEVETTFEVQPDNSIRCKGSKQLLMTDYNVEPPTFMFGSVTTGNEITVAFDLVLIPKKAPLTLK